MAEIPRLFRCDAGFLPVGLSVGLRIVVGRHQDEFFTGLKALVAEIKRSTDVPTAIGFGIHTPQQAQTMASIADGVIIGSAIVDIVAKEAQNAPAAIEQFTRAIRAAVDTQTESVVK